MPRSLGRFRWLLWPAIAAVILTLYWLALDRGPELLNPGLLSPNVGPSGSTPSPLSRGERATATHNARFLVVSFGGALAVLGGLLFTARTYHLAYRGQITERFTKALERLESPTLYVRIGAIQALQQVLSDAPSHHADIVEILVSFIRSRVPARGAPSPPEKLDSDVQAALSALSNRPHRKERMRIDLSGLHLKAARLQRAWLPDADFNGSDLSKSDFTGATLKNANLTFSALDSAVLVRTQLKGAKLDDAQMRGADLTGAKGLRPEILRGPAPSE